MSSAAMKSSRAIETAISSLSFAMVAILMNNSGKKADIPNNKHYPTSKIFLMDLNTLHKIKLYIEILKLLTFSFMTELLKSLILVLPKSPILTLKILTLAHPSICPLKPSFITPMARKQTYGLLVSSSINSFMVKPLTLSVKQRPNSEKKSKSPSRLKIFIRKFLKNWRKSSSDVSKSMNKKGQPSTN